VEQVHAFDSGRSNCQILKHDKQFAITVMCFEAMLTSYTFVCRRILMSLVSTVKYAWYMYPRKEGHFDPASSCLIT
jgi:hypothetical protein